MQSVEARQTYTSKGAYAFGIWNNESDKYASEPILLGNNPINALEVVSMLNISNLAQCMFHFNRNYSTGKYSPKVHLGTIQGISTGWLFDNNSGLKSELRDPQKSGS